MSAPTVDSTLATLVDLCSTVEDRSPEEERALAAAAAGAVIPPPPRHGPNDWCPHGCGCAVCTEWRQWHKARRAAVSRLTAETEEGR